MKDSVIGDLLSYACFVAGIAVLTRDDRAAKEISSIAQSYSSIIRAATGTDELESQLRLFESNYMDDPDSLPELEAELDRRIGLIREERHHRSWFDTVLSHPKVRERKVQW